MKFLVVDYTGQELRKKVTGRDELSHANTEFFHYRFSVVEGICTLRQGTELYFGPDFQWNTEKFWQRQNTCGECCSYGGYEFCCYKPTIRVNGKAESKRQMIQKEDPWEQQLQNVPLAGGRLNPAPIQAW